uniref:Ubiquitin carboxyl-terminal hydrolase n=1 Tax=Strigamia maritima TaxID=126957 RepID=T1IWA2_STRMM
MAEGGPSPPDWEYQKNEIANLMKKPLKKGDVWYLIDNRWIKQWKKYVGADFWDRNIVGEQGIHPGPIDNNPLFKDACSEEVVEIRDHLIDELDYVLLPDEVWNLLVSWYGLVEGQEPIPRIVVEYGMFVKHCKVEVYLMEFKLCQNNNLDTCISRKFSKVDTIEHIEEEMRKLFNTPTDKETRLWNRYTSSTYEHLSKKDATVQDAGLYQGQVLVIEVKNDDGSWSRQLKCSSSVSYNSAGYGNSTMGSGNGKQYNSSSNSTMSTRYGSMTGYSSSSGYSSTYNEGTAGTAQPGLCGLTNMGNTCFMNSAIQCMSNCPPLTNYFLEDRYWDELNTENPLGMKGEIAKAFGELIKIMWSGRYSYTVPRNFKMQVGRFAPQFSGYQQQDSQELMAFLLDGLHEDLNRIKKKPYIEQKDAEGRPDDEVSSEAWENYRQRNDSIIVDIFHGLLKSTLVCPECSKVSVTFDPFCYLTLPMPIRKERQMEVFLILLDPLKQCIQYKLTVPKQGTVEDLCKALSKYTSIETDRMMVTDVYNHRLHRVIPHDDMLNNIQERDDIFIYETPVSVTNEDPDTLFLPVYLKERKSRPGCGGYAASSQLFGQPLLVSVPRKDTTYDSLYRLILERMSRYVHLPDPKDDWWINDNDDENKVSVNGEVEMANGEEDYDDSDVTNEETESKDDISTKTPDYGSSDMQEDNFTPEGNYLFSMQFVNLYGNTAVDKIKVDGGGPIKFNNRSFVAIEWHPKAKEKFYDDKLAEALEQHESVKTRPPSKKQVIQLGECLELFTATEKLSAEDSWYCPSCKKHQQATKKFDLWSLPKILILCFKRFSYSRYSRDKIDALVEFPFRNLNMAKYIINAQHGAAAYDLIAVSNHYGCLGGGHYTAYAKSKDDNHWYNFDDNTVSSASEDSVVSKAAYVLFYIRRDNNENSINPPIHTRDIPAAVGTSGIQDNGDHSSDEDLAMDTI